MSIGVCVLIVVLLTSIQEEVLAQVLPIYGGAPMPYIDNEDDDIGILLTILLLASRNRNSGCCCNCCCGTPQNIPIPFPIPFPTNDLVVNKGFQEPDYDDCEDMPKDNNKNDENNIVIRLTTE